jgi:3-oxoacyl-[acyl-carrier protein] reductase
MDLQLRGRRCLVTGASAGIGASIARILACEGATVVVVARRADRLEALADECAGNGSLRPIVVAGDIAKKEEVGRIADAAARAVGPIQVLVNCAGGSRPAPLEAAEELWEEAFAINFSAGRRLSHALIPEMRKARWGRIINVTSLMEPLSLNAAIAAKAAFNLWAKGISRDLAPEGITVNTIAPGRIESEQVNERLFADEQSRHKFAERHIPMGYFGIPEDLANLAVFLASPLSRYITGALIPVDGGMKYAAA